MLCKKTPNTLKDRKNALLSASFVVVLLSLVMLPLRLYAQPTAQELTEKGDSCRMVGKYKKALEYFQQAYDAPAVANDVNMQLQLLERIMRTHDVLRHWKEMPESSYRLFTLAKEHGDSAHTAMALMIQGKRLHILGKTQEGMRVCLHATEMMKRTNFEHKNHELANFYAILAKLYCNEGNYGEEHHYYVDRKDVKRNSKIYINDATDGATQLKQIFDLSVPSGESPAVLNEHVEACKNLEFFLHTNITVPSGSPAWEPIGTDEHCFEGNLHGDGYHIDGLDHSLFRNLCGNVYNLGVTGSFTSAGIADKEDAEKDKAYMENCWINTSATEGFTTKAILGADPTKNTERKRVVNCYYQNTKEYRTGDAIPMPEIAFYNGTVGYDLNGFYLYKRYNNTKTGSGIAHTFYTINSDGTLSVPQTKNYVDKNATYCSSGITDIYDNGGYVEDRFADGDFRYADGVIPETEETRMFTGTDKKTHFYPIWPDDYIYFGQMLTYDWNNQRPHEDVPSHIVKSNGRLTITDESNRIYRAPAYYQSKVMDVAHFNPNVNLVAYSKPKGNNDKDLKAAYPNMTAIDFAGHNDTQWSLGRVSSGSPAVVTATFNYPDAAGDDVRQVGNTFLWDYYYSENTQKDAHTDTYQTRYEASRTMEQYPLLDAAKPYMIGIPGKTFYEFDLSGEWKVKNTATTAPEQLGKQTISFVSKTGISIAVSDDEISASAIDANDYKFMPNYMSKKVVGYLMNQDGNSFDVTPSGGSAASPFRPYFVSTASAPARSILFDNEDASFTFDDRDPSDDDLGEGNLVLRYANILSASPPHSSVRPMYA